MFPIEVEIDIFFVVVVYFSVLPFQALIYIINKKSIHYLFIACSSLVKIDGPLINYVYYVF